MTEDPVKKADTPVPVPPSKLDMLKSFLGDMARPFAIWSTSGSTSWAIVVIANRGTNYVEAAAFIGAAFAGLGALYGAKALEVIRAGGQAAALETAKVNAAQPTTTTTTTSQSGVTTKVETPTPVAAVAPKLDDGELPPDQRVRL